MAKRGFVRTMGKEGRVGAPAKIREALDLRGGDKVLFRLKDGVVRLIPLKQAVRMAQESVRGYVPEGTSLVDALLEERKDE